MIARAFLLSLALLAGTSFAQSDERLRLGDELQEKRTTSVNWPRSRTTRVAAATSTAPPATPAAAVDTGPRRFRVMVDVGHGGHDHGAPGIFGVLEKDICLKIAGFVRGRLERLAKLSDFPLEVRMSRDSDRFLSLRDRVKLANEWSADLFISIHANSSPVPRARGFEVYFLSSEASDADASRLARQENAEGIPNKLSEGVMSILSDLQANQHVIESSRFAEAVYSSLAERLPPNGRGVRQAPFTVLSGTKMPALLIEVGYLTNSAEAATLQKRAYQHRLATGISEGVLDFALRLRRLGKAPPRPGQKRTT